ncbi:MAG: hypothetical protein J0H98_07785 [Solirubrobacterales bacterium]|nr:hypothetical protein [Solirubrobacterales bacterium]
MAIKAATRIGVMEREGTVSESPFYIPMTGPLARPRRTLKHDDTFLVLDSHGDIGASAGGPDGLFHSDTRHLARFELVLNDMQPLLLGSNLRDDNSGLTVDLTNPDIFSGGRIVLQKDMIHIVRTIFLWRATAYQRIGVQNHGDSTARFDLTLLFDSDFADLFEVRGERRPRRGSSLSEIHGPADVSLIYTGLDENVRTTGVHFDPSPTTLSVSSASYRLKLAPQQVASLFVAISCNLPAEQKIPPFFRGLLAHRREMRESTAGAATIGERRDLLERAVDLIAGLIAATRTAAEADTAAGGAAAEAAREATERGFDSVEEAMAAAREEADLAALRSRVSQHDQAMAVVDGQLEELAEVDAGEKLDPGPAEARARESARDREAKSRLAGVAANQLETFRQETERVPRLYEELAPLREAAATSTELDRLAGGRNDRKMKLSIYVLATRLRQVIEAANHHLQRMSNQRYELLYTGDKNGNAMAGLGIEVADAYTSETRPTTTLSGGESFYASLALALGLAEIVQQESGGKKLETLFIDEGFGTLDAKSLDQVMDVIDSLRAGGRSVGLVSHVEELRNRIPAQIRVASSRRGSTVTVTAAFPEPSPGLLARG